MSRVIKFEYVLKNLDTGLILREVLNLFQIEKSDPNRFLGGRFEVIAKRQFTGLKDKNGVEVWEGDIVRAPSGNFFVTIWCEKEMGWRLKFEGVVFNINAPLYEVAGNIHQHPELIT